jgi:hypothetical protein
VNDNVWNLDEATRTDMRLLLVRLKEYSGYVLTEGAVFKPFGASVDLQGEVGLSVAKLNGQPELSEYRDAMIKGFREQAGRGEIRAAGYAELGRYRVEDGASEKDAVVIRIECRTGVCGLVVVPYSVDAPSKVVSFGKEYVLRDEPWVWAKSNGPKTVEPGATPPTGNRIISRLTAHPAPAVEKTPGSYVILENDNRPQLMAEVNRRMAQGWKPLGGVACYYDSSSQNAWYVQAMTLASTRPTEPSPPADRN